MSGDDWIQVRYGNGGWVRADASDWPGPVYVRFATRGGRLVPLDVYVDTRGEGIAGAYLRQLKLSTITALAAEGWDENRERLPGPDLSRLASHFSTTFGQPAKHWVADSFRAQSEGSGVPQAPMGPDRYPPAPKPVRLSPPEEGLTDEFLHEVKAAYGDAVRRGKRPGPELAEQTNVSVRTVHAWVAKARDRGIMPRGSQGKVG